MADRFYDLVTAGVGGAGTLAAPWQAAVWRQDYGAGGGLAGDLWYDEGIYSVAISGAVSSYIGPDDVIIDGCLPVTGEPAPWGIDGATDFGPSTGIGRMPANYASWHRAMFNTGTLSFHGPNSGADEYWFQNCFFCRPTLPIQVDSVYDITLHFNGCTFKTPMLDFVFGFGSIKVQFHNCLFDGPVFHHWYDGMAGWLQIECHNCTFTRKASQVYGGMGGTGVWSTVTDCTFEKVLAKQLPSDINDVNRSSMLFSQYGLDEYNGAWTDHDFGFDAEPRQGVGAFYFGLADASATASPSSGQAPLKVDFEGGGDVGVVAYHWDFGDGYTSDEQSPSHEYAGPGTYTATYTYTDALGHTSSYTITVYVYTWDYSSGYIVNKTDACFRFAMPDEPAQGVGWAFYTGDSWPQAIGRVGTCEIIDANDERVPLVMDCSTFEIHELGIADQWKDGEGDYTGQEQEAEILFPEVAAPVGQTAKLKHNQTDVDIKPRFKELIGTTGYDDNGFRTGFNLDVFWRTDSKLPDVSVAKRVPFKGQVVADRHFESDCIQVGVRPRVAPWRLVRVKEYLEQQDTASAPAQKLMSEMSYALELTEPVTWIGRCRLNPLLDRATGLTCGGSYTTVVAGPDGYAGSALALGASGSILATPNVATLGDATMIFFIRQPTFPVVLLSYGPVTVELHDNGGHIHVKVDWGTEHSIVNLDQSYSDWTMLALVRDGNFLKVYENGHHTNTVGITGTSIPLGGAMTLYTGGVSVWDTRFVARAVGESALLWLYQDAVANSGNSTQDIW
jgi:PKD repeat protein